MARGNEEQTFAQSLGINKSPDWVANQFYEVDQFIRDNYTIFGNLMGRFCENEGREGMRFTLVLSANNCVEFLIRLTNLFYAIGFMKGKVAQEEISNLEKLVGGEDKKNPGIIW